MMKKTKITKHKTFKREILEIAFSRFENSSEFIMDLIDFSYSEALKEDIKRKYEASIKSNK